MKYKTPIFIQMFIVGHILLSSRQSFARTLYFEQSIVHPKTEMDISDSQGRSLGFTKFDQSKNAFILFGEDGSQNAMALIKKDDKIEKSLLLFEKDNYFGKLEYDQDLTGYIVKDAKDQVIIQTIKDLDNKNNLQFLNVLDLENSGDPTLKKAFNSNQAGSNLTFTFTYEDDSSLDERTAIFLAAKEMRENTFKFSKKRRSNLLRRLIVPTGILLTAGVLLYKYRKIDKEVSPEKLENDYKFRQNQELALLTEEKKALESEELILQAKELKFDQDTQTENIDIQAQIDAHAKNYQSLSDQLKKSEELKEINLNLFQDIGEKKRSAYLSRKAVLEGRALSLVQSEFDQLKPVHANEVSIQLKEDLKRLSDKKTSAEHHMRRFFKNRKIVKQDLSQKVSDLKLTISQHLDTIKTEKNAVAQRDKAITDLNQTISDKDKALKINSKIIAGKSKKLNQYKIDLEDIKQKTDNNIDKYDNLAIKWNNLVSQYKQKDSKIVMLDKDVNTRDQAITQHVATIAARNLTINQQMATIAAKNKQIAADALILGGARNLSQGGVNITVSQLMSMYNSEIAKVASLQRDLANRDQSIRQHLATITTKNQKIANDAQAVTDANNIQLKGLKVSVDDFIKEYNARIAEIGDLEKSLKEIAKLSKQLSIWKNVSEQSTSMWSLEDWSNYNRSMRLFQSDTAELKRIFEEGSEELKKLYSESNK